MKKKYIFFVIIIAGLVLCACDATDDKIENNKIVIESTVEFVDSNNGVIQKIMEIFQSQHQKSKVDLIYNPGLDITELNTKKSDIYIIEDKNISSLIQNNKVHSLNNNVFIKDAYEQMYEGLMDLSTYQNKVFGVPININIHVFIANKTIADKYNLELPEYWWSWNEFFELGDYLYEVTNMNDEKIVMLESNIVDLLRVIIISSGNKFNNGELFNFKNEEFFNIIRKALEAYDRNIILNSNSEKPLNNFLDNKVFLIPSIFSFAKSDIGICTNEQCNHNNEHQELVYVPIPTLEQGVSYRPSLIYFVINNKSNNIHLSESFLEKSISIDVMKELFSSRLYKSTEVYKESELFLQHFNYSRKMEEQYEYLINTSQRSVMRDVNEDLLNKSIGKYIKKEMDEHSFAQELNYIFNNIMDQNLDY